MVSSFLLDAVKQSVVLCAAAAAYTSKRLYLFHLQVWIEDDHLDIVRQVAVGAIRLWFYSLQLARVTSQMLKENVHGLNLRYGINLRIGSTNEEAPLCTKV